MRADLRFHNRADLFTQNGAANVASGVQVEDQDRQGVFAAEADGGGVHHAQPQLQHVGKADGVEHLRVAVPRRVRVVDALDLGGLHDHLGVDLHGAQRGRGVGGEIRVAGTADPYFSSDTA